MAILTLKVLEKFDLKQYRLQVASSVVSDVDVEQVGMDARVKFGDSRSRPPRDIREVHFVMNGDQHRHAQVIT